MDQDSVIIDSQMSFDEAVAGIEFPSEIRSQLALVEVQYVSFDGLIHQGQLVVHTELAEDVKVRFSELLALRFPIEKVIPIAKYGWDDLASMEDNNTSAFNYRVILNTERLSNHSYGRALDINPAINPYTMSTGELLPKDSLYDIKRPGTFVVDSEALETFISNGWSWAGSWTRPDWQHFEKGTPPR